MALINLNASLPQQAFQAKQVLENEAIVAKTQNIAMYDLMEAAGLAVFKLMTKSSVKNKSLLVVCGKGNNGGDGFIVARLAKEAGWRVTVLLFAKSQALSGDALQAFKKLQKIINVIEESTTDSLNNQLTKILHQEHFTHIVDAIFGIGFRGVLPQNISNAIEQLNKEKTEKIAIDLPSGVNATTGDVTNIAFIANTTMSFIVHKQGLFTGQAVNYVGKVKLATLGLSQPFIKQVSTRTSLQGNTKDKQQLPLLSKRKISSHKGDIGHLLTIGGNVNFPGAIRLASEAALRSGAALVSVCSHEKSQLFIHSKQPELMIAGHCNISLKENEQSDKYKQLLIGPGLGKDEWAKKLFTYALALHKPMVIDADALTLLSQHQLSKSTQYRDNWVLTPHPGEAARLLNCSIAEIENNRFTAINNIVNKYGGICVLKGAGTLISDGKHCWINTSGNPAMASGGMGDVLSGIIAALLIQMNDKLAAVRLAVFIHGVIADKIVKQQGEIGLLASDIIKLLPKALHQYSK